MACIRAAGLSRPGLAAYLLCCLPALAWAVDGQVQSSPQSGNVRSASASLFDFDIPAQPLIDALKRYANLTRQPTLFRSELAAGLISSAVHGRYSSEAALHLLLEGTGLDAEKIDAGDPDGAFVLKGIDAPQAAAPRADAENAASRTENAGYPSLVQATVWDALCRDARTAPGAYRSVLRFEVDAAGQIRRARMLGSTGEARRDAAMLEILRRLRMERPPPPGMPQPVTLLILPRDPDIGQHCETGAGAAF